MRISSGPSARKLKPRSGQSSCGEETPRSARMPATCDAPSHQPELLMCVETSPKSPRMRRTRSWPKRRSRAPAASRARSSRSIPRSRTPGHCSNSASLCPAPPSVQSTTMAPSAKSAAAKASTTSGSMTDTCWKTGASTSSRWAYPPAASAERTLDAGCCAGCRGRSDVAAARPGGRGTASFMATFTAAVSSRHLSQAVATVVKAMRSGSKPPRSMSSRHMRALFHCCAFSNALSATL
mmetsp:Transcript_19334/g.53078  ORF Transcript_19334/g.53078 Transcript_19334/m.53078 type:complete len:238 (-) Transcript_19334:669-1382(-)